MIDWFNLAANSLWIAGCALALSVLSYASYEAWLYREKFRARLGLPGYQTVLNIAGFLFCLGLALTSLKYWEIAVWAVLGALFLLQVGVGIYQARKKPGA